MSDIRTAIRSSAPETQHEDHVGQGPRRLQSVGGRSRRAARAIGTTLTFAIVLALFGLAAFHAVIVTQQRTFDEINGRLDAAAASNEALRVQLTELEAPERILTAAQQKLGMVPVEPSQITYLTPPHGELAEATVAQRLAGYRG